MRNSADDGLQFPQARVAQVRVARHTAQLETVVAFYRDALGLPELYRFVGHDGYDGVMLGLPGRTFHLEFTQCAGGTAPSSPSADDLLVLYVPDSAQLESWRERLEFHGHSPVTPLNPYWLRGAVTFEDPDGWRVVLCNSEGI